MKLCMSLVLEDQCISTENILFRAIKTKENSGREARYPPCPQAERMNITAQQTCTLVHHSAH